MLRINGQISIADSEVEIVPIRALRFDIPACSLPDALKQRLLALPDQRISKDGVLVIKAAQYRSQDKNRQAALQRLTQFIRRATVTRKQRIATRPTRGSREKRLDSKNRRGRTKALRGKVVE
jgi:ribosome-associated protein